MKSDSTRTLLFGIFVQAHRALTAAQVIRLAQPLGISATNVKSHLTRMVAEGVLERSGPVRLAQYSPTSKHAAVIEGLQARLRDLPDQPWNGAWILLTLRMPATRAYREQLKVSLWFDGFRPFAPGVFVRPAWPQPWATDRSQSYLGYLPGLVIQGSLLGRLDPVRMYAMDQLDREAHRLARAIIGKPAPRSAADAWKLQMRVGGDVARLIGHDPRLPPQLWSDRRGLRELVLAYRRFETRIAPAAQRYRDDVLRTPR